MMDRIEYEIYCDDECVAMTDSELDARHYADLYAMDGRVAIYRVDKRYEMVFP